MAAEIPTIRLEDREHEEPPRPSAEAGAHSSSPGDARPQTAETANSHPDSAIDILYENQRGSFLCGIPLFSHKSLLNFDPPAWVRQDYTASPVNITNAQVPDPSWEWQWKSWYVDMSEDVDEEGWAYSAWLFKGFSWHGRHPWWHSFVRRRRWLRRRVKRKHSHHPPKDEANSQQQQRRGSTGTSIVPSTFQITGHVATIEDVPEEISDVPKLMVALKRATIDREKILIVKSFLEDGGEELHYLADQIPEIMASLIFQNSRRQLLAAILDVINAAEDHRRGHEERQTAEGEEEHRRTDSLIRAKAVAEQECRKLEYWSDGRVAKGFSSHSTSGRSSRLYARSDCADSPKRAESPKEGSRSEER